MVVRREGDSKKIFYYCARHYRTWDKKACGFRKFLPAKWDDYIWDCVYALLNDDSWMEQQLQIEQHHHESAAKLIDVEQRKINQLQAKVTKVQAGYEDGIYNAEEAKKRINDCQKAIDLAGKEIERIRHQAGTTIVNESGIVAFKHELETMRQTNLESASFDEKLYLMGLLGIKVYPSEDLSTVRIRSSIGIDWGETDSAGGEKSYCGKVLFAPAKGIRTIINA